MKLKKHTIVNNFFKKSTWFIILMIFSTLSLATSAAYYSIIGLSSLFAGSSYEVMVMASSLEFSKLIIASYLHNHWSTAGLVKWYLTTALLILMLITSAGIYGFLTAAFQQTSDRLELIDNKIKFIELKRDRFNNVLESYRLEKEDLNVSIVELTKGLSNNTIQYRDKVSGEIITTTSSATRKVLSEQLNYIKQQEIGVRTNIEIITDSINKMDFKILELQTNNDLASDVGPLKYMAKLLNKPMNLIVNWFTLLIVFVFDPLAISMVIAVNKLINYGKYDNTTNISDGIDNLTTVDINSNFNNQSDKHDRDVSKKAKNNEKIKETNTNIGRRYSDSVVMSENRK